MRKLIILIIVILIIAAGIGAYFILQKTLPQEESSSFSTSSNIKLEWIKSLQLTTESDGYGARPEIISNGNYFFVVYLGDIAGQRSFKVMIYDKDFNLIKKKNLVSGSLQYGGPTDIRITRDGSYVYLFYEIASKEKGTHLFGEKYELNENFDKVAESNGPIAESSFFFDAKDGEELLDDPASVIADGKVYVMTKIRNNAAGLKEAKTLYRVRELSSDLSKIIETKDIDLSETMDGWAGLNSLFYANEKIYHIQSSIASFSPNINPDLKLLKFNKNWEVDKISGEASLTDTAKISETMPTGARFINNLLFISYRVGEVEKVGTGNPTSIGEIWLNIYDANFKLKDSICASSEGLLGEHSTVETVDNYAYVAYGAKRSSETKENLYVAIFRFSSK